MNNLLNNKFSLFGPGILLAISGMIFFPPVKLVLNGAVINITQGARLVIENPASDAIIRNSGYIVSEGQNNRVQWNIGATAGDYVVPWGYNSNYMPVSFTTSTGAGSGYFDLSTYHTPWNNSTQLPTGISEFDNAGGDDNSPFVADRFWQVNALGYTTKPTLTNLKFTYLESEFTASGNTITENNLRAQRFNSTTGTWSDYAPTGSVNTTDNTVNISSLAPTDLFHWWVLVDVSSPLPIQLVTFNAIPDGQRVKLNWVTSNETNNDFFTVEKSMDGRTFVFVEKVDGAGTSSRILNYNTIDYSPYSGVSYYRLKQTDLDGKASYSKVISVDMGQSGALSFNLYPNPSPGGELTLKFKNATTGTMQVKIVDLVGKEVFVQGITVANNGEYTTTISVPGKLPSGAYFVKIESNDNVYTKMFVLRKGA